MVVARRGKPRVEIGAVTCIGNGARPGFLDLVEVAAKDRRLLAIGVMEQLAEAINEGDQHGGMAGRGLTDLIEGGIGDPGKRRTGYEQPDDAVLVPPLGLDFATLHHRRERLCKTIDDVAGGMRIVDAGL